MNRTVKQLNQKKRKFRSEINPEPVYNFWISSPFIIKIPLKLGREE
ncbi:unnamed protein product [Moneuplotes crassus]|uniref:Uncharacterized protein n=1 Tax=Euplotes crassus TaxID=5936 RepID=A0AAD1XV22_EUPCR|nr:unnamed protein product [Moneuplotes crassus]